MALLDQIQKDMVQAMKAKDELRLSTVRMIKAALHKREVDTMKQLDPAAEMQVMTTLIKQRKEAADLYRKGGRTDLAEKEEAELRTIEGYLPEPATDDDIHAAVEQAIAETGAADAKQMGEVMKAAQAKLAGKRVDGKALSGHVRARLG